MAVKRVAGARVGQRLVAEDAGVSVATVSNTLNRPEVVAPETRARILEAMERLGFVHNEAAASLKRGSNHLLGLVIPDITNSFYSEITRGVAAAADAAGYGVVLCNSADDPATELEQLGMLARLRAAGALVVPLTADRARLDRLRDVGTHLVLIDRVADALDGCSAAIDDVRGGEIAAHHLLDTGREGIALVNGRTSIPQCANRRQGVRNALLSAGTDLDESLEETVEEMTTPAGRTAALALVDRLRAGGRPLPGGIVCTNDQLAIGVVRGLAERGVAVPEEVAVVGYGDLAIAADAPVPLTTIEQPKYQLGRAAVELLLEEIGTDESAHVHASRVYTPSLVVRSSAP